MRRLATLAVVVSVAAGGFLAASPAQAYCPLPGYPVVPCASLVDDCVTVRVYNVVTGAPSTQVCLHP